MSKKEYDLIIIGAGPAGLAASIYASRYGIKHAIFGSILGGQISETHEIDNYPGMESMTGVEFSQKWGHHVEKYGIKIIPQRVEWVKKVKNEENFEIKLENGETYESRVVLLATGTKRKKLMTKGEKELIGKGVSYCATCDGFFYKNKTVAVVGGGNSAVGAATYLARICEKVYLIYRKNMLKCEVYWKKIVDENPKIEVIYETNVEEITGNEKVEKIILDKKYKNSQELAVSGVFIEIGSDPDLSYALNLGVETDEKGYVKVDKKGKTNISGVWAAGDLTDGSDKFNCLKKENSQADQ
jgi:thioredoxin-disulfide reductase